MRLSAILLALGLGLAPVAGAAELVNADTVENLTGALQSLGYPTRVTLDSQGDPKIESSFGGQPFTILMYRCENGATCDYILLQGQWDRPGFTAEQSDEWNDIGIYGAANVTNGGNPALGQLIDLAGGGIPIDNLKSQMDRWVMSMARFEAHIDKGKTP